MESHKIVMWTLEGKGGYGDSPKYIAEEIIRRDREGRKGKGKYRIVWLMDVSGQDSQDFPDEIETVKDSVWNRAYHLV